MEPRGWRCSVTQRCNGEVGEKGKKDKRGRLASKTPGTTTAKAHGHRNFWFDLGTPCQPVVSIGCALPG